MRKKHSDNERFIDDGVKYAQKIAQEKGFKAGQAVAHPSDPYTYHFEKTEGESAEVVIYPKESKTGKEIRKKLPIVGLFAVNVAQNKAIELRAASILEEAMVKCS